MFIPVRFILFYATANWNSKFYFSGCLLQVCKNTILSIYHVCILQPWWSICSNRFLVDSSGFFIYQTLSSASKGSFTSFFPIWISHIYFLAYLAQPEPPMQCRIGVARAVILVLFLLLAEKHPIFHYCVWWQRWFLHWCPGSGWGSSLPFLVHSLNLCDASPLALGSYLTCWIRRVTLQVSGFSLFATLSSPVLGPTSMAALVSPDSQLHLFHSKISTP